MEATYRSTADAQVANQRVSCTQVRLEILAAAALLGSAGLSLTRACEIGHQLQ